MYLGIRNKTDTNEEPDQTQLVTSSWVLYARDEKPSSETRFSCRTHENGGLLLQAPVNECCFPVRESVTDRWDYESLSGRPDSPNNDVSPSEDDPVSNGDDTERWVDVNCFDGSDDGEMPMTYFAYRNLTRA